MPRRAAWCLLALSTVHAVAATVPAPADWIPARWSSTDPRTLALLAETPVNCLLLDPNTATRPFLAAAREQGVATLALIPPAGDPTGAAERALAQGFTGIALEGNFEPAISGKVRTLAGQSTVVEIGPRVRMRFDSPDPIVATNQGVWPGIQVQENGAAKAAPSGAPWIDTNTGFLRFAHAVSNASVWIANTPPPRTIITTPRYLQAIGDAAMSGAHWVLALDSDFATRLYSGEATALRDWKQIAAYLRFFNRPDWRKLEEAGQLALVQDTDSGALLSGGILDMIAVKHTPVRPVPNRRLSDDRMRGSQMAVNVDPQSLTPEQREILRRFTRGGGTLLSGPPGWKMPAAKAEEITLGKDDLEKLDQIWKEMNAMTGRRNLGARLFNVSSMLSNFEQAPDGKLTVLHLINYSDYPAESITVHLLGKYKSARLLTPEGVDRPLELFEIEEGCGVEIDKIVAAGSIILTN